MSRGIFLIGENNELVELREQPYDSEALLQELLANYPSILAGDQMDQANPRRWLLVTREMSLPCEEGGSGRWSVDHLLIDQDAVPTVVEVKRSSDTRIRREVVGQMLEYAANAVVYWPVETLRARFESTCRERGVEAADELSSFLGEGGNLEVFWAQVKTNLLAGKIRMVFVADEIPAELRRMVEFLNQQMDPAEVLAVEIKQYVSGGLRTLVPSVIGQTEEARIKKGATSIVATRQWDEVSFFQELRRVRPVDEVNVGLRLLEWSKTNAGEPWWGKGQKLGSFGPVFTIAGTNVCPFMAYTYGSVEVHFQYLMRVPPFDSEMRRRELLQRLNSIPGVSISESNVTKRPSIRFSLLTDHSKLTAFLAVFDWVIEQMDLQMKSV